MKKKMSRICCVLAAMAMLGGCASSAAPSGGTPSDSGNGGTEPVQNEAPSAAVFDDFEVNYDGWCTDSQSFKLTAEEGKGFNGSRGMTVSGRRKAVNSVYSVKGMYLKGGVDYTYSMMVYSDSAETFHLELATSSANSMGEKSAELASVTVEPGTWTELKAQHTAPENSGMFKLTLKTDSKDDFRFDNVTITPKDKKDLPSASAEKGLKDEFAGSFRVGNILNGRTVGNGEITDMVLANYNSITCENETKPDSTLVQTFCTDDNIAVSINNAAPIFDFCARNNIGVRGHTLVWHSQTPVWFFKDDFKNTGEWVTPEVMDKRMESYIKNMFETIKTQYPGLDLYAYDVVNEAISDDTARTKLYGGARQGGDNNKENGKSAWVQVYGDNSFVEKAFVYARKYAPEGCKLFYNDYNEYWGHKRDKMFEMCKNLYNKGLLDGIGMQSHVNADIDGFSGAATHAEAMKMFLTIGCEVQVTELDMTCEGGKLSLDQQAAKCKAIFKTAMDCNADPQYPGKVTAICIWGPNDANTWISPENTPLLHDTSNQPKPAYNALLELVPEAEWGDGKNPVKYELAGKEVNLDPTEDDRCTRVLKKEKVEEPEEKPADAEAPKGSGEYSDSFEENECDWFGRGSAAVSVSGDAAFEGDKSLFIEGRSAAWNGASKLLDPEAFVPGSVCSFSVNVMFNDGDDTDLFFMKLQYVDGDGTTQYASVAEGTANNGEWMLLENKEYQIPSDATDMQIYVETANSLNNFYIDAAAAKSAA